MNDYRRFIKAIGMAVLIVSMLGGSVFAAERVAVRTAGESSPGGNGFGLYVPIAYKLPVEVSGLTNAGGPPDPVAAMSITAGTVKDFILNGTYMPDMLLGYKIGIRNVGYIEPVAGLYYINVSNDSTVNTLGVGVGGKFFYEFVKGSVGNVYGGGTAVLSYLSTSIKDFADLSIVGLSVLGNIGVEVFPFESLKKFGLTFDTGIPVLSFSSVGLKPSGGSTTSFSRINILERLPLFTLGVHVYF